MSHQPLSPRAAAEAARKWIKPLAPYMAAQNGKATFQLLSTAALFAAGWALAYLSLEVSYFLALAVAVPTAGLQVRLFIFQHDCGHGSFFSSRRANNVVGFVLGVITLTPFHYWRRTHAIHHGTSGDLDRRGFGDIETLTVREYKELSPWGRFLYRLYRHPFVLLVIAPIYQFAIKHRLPFDIPRNWRREWASVFYTNAVLAVVLVVFWQTIGIKKFLLVQAPVFGIAGMVGMWLFYVQHQFEDTYWREHEAWEFCRAGVEGSSYYELPRVLQWFTGNIGFHHIHHLAARIPNYRLEECFREVAELRHVTRLSLGESIRCARLKLWDEAQQKLIGFRELRASSE